MVYFWFVPVMTVPGSTPAVGCGWVRHSMDSNKLSARRALSCMRWGTSFFKRPLYSIKKSPVFCQKSLLFSPMYFAKNPKFWQNRSLASKEPCLGFTRALECMKRALSCVTRALSHIQKTLSSVKRALYYYSVKKSLCCVEIALSCVNKALSCMKRDLFVFKAKLGGP